MPPGPPFLTLFADRIFRITDEVELHDEIARLLTKGGYQFKQEVRLSHEDRVDFLIGDVALEVKVRGGRSHVIRQLHRYAQHERIAQLVLATTRWSLAHMPSTISEKPVFVLPLYLGAL